MVDKDVGGAPAYARGHLSRDIMDILRDAPRRTLKREYIKNILEKRRSKEVLPNAISQALRRMMDRGDVRRIRRGTYVLIAEPIPDRFDNLKAWLKEKT